MNYLIGIIIFIFGCIISFANGFTGYKEDMNAAQVIGVILMFAGLGFPILYGAIMHKK